jgi:hypothetical protein
VDGADPHAVVRLARAEAELLFQVGALGGVWSDDADRGFRRELR